MSMFVTKALEDRYYKDKKLTLHSITNLHFTPREIDIIACGLSGRHTSDDIASFLSIESKTVESHKSNYKNKLGGRNIRDLIENSSDRDNIKATLSKHYSHILAQDYYFKQKIQNISNKTKPLIVKIYYFRDQESDYLIGDRKKGSNGQFIKHLTAIQCNIETQNIAEIEFDNNTSHHSTDTNNTHNVDFVIFVVSEAFIKFLDDHKFKLNKYIELLSPTSVIKDKNKIICLMQTNVDNVNNLAIASSNKIINKINFQQNYHRAFFELLQTMLPSLHTEIKKFIIEFDQLYSTSSTDIKHIFAIDAEDMDSPGSKKFIFFKSAYLMLYFNNNKLRVFGIFFAFMLCVSIGIILLISKDSHKLVVSGSTKHGEYLTSELIMPVDTVFLNRDTLVSEIDDKFQGNDEIQTIALVGVGGAGKTTLARKYAHGSWASIIWEINAESTETIQASFENFANALAKTEEDQKIMQYIQKIPSSEQRDTSIVSFVKNKLKENPNWLLIYDNVDNLVAFQKYFPQDPLSWGKGKVIVTTRDSNIHNNHHITNVIDIGILNDEQKLKLFLKIMYNEQDSSLSAIQLQEITKFLEIIPPFPLDVSTAAYYLKDTKTSFDKYIENLNQNSANFDNVQSSLLKETGNYTSTRYSIITMSLEHLIQTDPNFIDLMLFVCLLDSQNIPRTLLETYKNSSIVDDFLHNLKKYSFTIHESSSHLGQTFSVHRSTQNISLAYFIQTLTLQTHNSAVGTMVSALSKNIDDAIDKDDIAVMKLLIPHAEALLGHSAILTEEMQGVIESKLGGIYYYLGDAAKTSVMLSKGLEILNKHYDTHYEAIAQALIYSGSMYASLEDMTKAQNCFRQSLKIYQEKFSDSHPNVARIIIHLGYHEQELGHYTAAQELFEHGLSLYEQHHPSNYARIAWSLSYLGNINRKMGDYQNAKSLLEKSLDIYTQHCPNQRHKIAVTITALGKVYRDIGNYDSAIHWLKKGVDLAKQDFGDTNPWHLVYLGNTYRHMGNYKEAQAILEKCFDTYKKHAPQNYVDWISIYLGAVHSNTGHYEEAKNMLEPSLTSYQKMFGKDSIKTAWVLMRLGNVYTHLSDYTRAQSYLEQSLEIYTNNFSKNHIKMGHITFLLGNNYMLSGNLTEAKKLLDQSLSLHQNHYGQDHITTAKILTSLGKNELLQGNLDAAESFLVSALGVFRKNTNPDIYYTLETMADLNVEKSNRLSQQEPALILEFQKLKDQSVAYLNEALNSISINFPNPDTSAHSIRIKAKIDNLIN